MKRRILGLHEADAGQASKIPDSLYLARVDKVQYRWQAQKPYYVIRLVVLEPQHYSRRSVTGRLYCTPRALWKLNWFLRDFGYDAELIDRDEIDEKGLIGLRGIVKISHVVVHGTSMLNLEGFAPAAQWEELSPASVGASRLEEAAS